jgi:hypothetical protein
MKTIIFVFCFTCSLFAKGSLTTVDLTVKEAKINKDFSIDIVAEAPYNCKTITLNTKPTTKEEADKHIMPLALVGWDCKTSDAAYEYDFSDPDIRDNVNDYVAKTKGLWTLKIDDVNVNLNLAQ